MKSRNDFSSITLHLDLFLEDLAVGFLGLVNSLLFKTVLLVSLESLSRF